MDIDKLLAGAKLASVQAEFDYWEQVALKLAKACGQKMALSTIQGQTITELVEAGKQKGKKKGRSHEAYGEAKAMDKETAERIEAEKQEKRQAKKAKAWESWKKANQRQEKTLWKQFLS